MSSFETSSPVSASTFAYLMRWPVFLLIWLKLIFSESEVAGYRATGQVTRERRKKPFQLARGAIGYSKRNEGTGGLKTFWSVRSDNQSFRSPPCKGVLLLFLLGDRHRGTTENKLGPLVPRECRQPALD